MTDDKREAENKKAAERTLTENQKNNENMKDYRKKYRQKRKEESGRSKTWIRPNPQQEGTVVSRETVLTKRSLKKKTSTEAPGRGRTPDIEEKPDSPLLKRHGHALAEATVNVVKIFYSDTR